MHGQQNIKIRASSKYSEHGIRSQTCQKFRILTLSSLY